VASALAASQDERIRALVLEAPYADLNELLAQIAWRDFWLPRYPLLPLVRLAFYAGAGVPPGALDVASEIAGLGQPLFLIHGMNDKVIPVTHAQRIMQLRRPDEIWIVPGGEHVNSWNMDSSQAESKSIAFFQKHLK
jgi:fermentation-respiration switch protein FrsA (DUF1100 family)